MADDSSRTIQERLVRACISGNLDIAAKMIRLGASPSALDSLHRTPLMYAARFGRKPIVEFLCALKVDVNANRDLPGQAWSSDRWPYLDLEGGTALMDCALQGDTGVARILTANGADVNAKSSLGNTALFYAAQAGRLEMVGFLLEKSADMNAVNQFNETALSYAVRAHRADVVDLLLNAKHRPNTFSLSAAMYAAADSDDFCLAKRLVRHGYIEDTAFSRARRKGDPLIRASVLGRREIVGLLLKTGTNPEKRRGFYDPLAAATGAGNPAMIGYLLEHGASPKVGGDISTDFLSRVAYSRNPELYRQFLAHGDSLRFKKYLLDVPYPTGLSPELFELHLQLVSGNKSPLPRFAALKREFQEALSPQSNIDVKTIRNLGIAMRFGIPIDFDSLGITRLMALAVAGDTGAMKREIGEDTPRNMLREVKISARTADQMTALGYAIQANQFDAVELLVDCGAEVNPSIPDHARHFLLPLEWAFTTGNRKLVEYLLGKGARLRTRSISRNTKVDYFYHVFKYAKSSGAYDLPLLIAFENAGYFDLFFRLVEEKDTSLSSLDYQLALVLASVNGYQEAAEYLFSHIPGLAEELTKPFPGRSYNAADYAFYGATNFNHLPILKLLGRTVKETADWRVPLFTSLRVAERYGHRESTEYILQLAFGVNGP